ncbi:hypothetical protein ACNKHQ_23945 [Shigella flexneri]
MKRRCLKAYTTPISPDNLRYSQNAALDMYKEVNTGSGTSPRELTSTA